VTSTNLGRCPTPIGILKNLNYQVKLTKFLLSIKKGFGTCVMSCFGDSSCPAGQKCCSNGCGKVCMSMLI
jgi:hypothetical protein